ncbi:MAG: D-2-hydroxyacid dehydrogenase [Verrucomicrobiae bacterium]|nr:D-2-hydroxyacid dehydrogenase [Verrucomicrobiae bacterium]
MSDSPTLVFLDRDTLDAGDVDFSDLEAIGPVTYFPLTRSGERASRVGEAEIILTNKVMIDVETMDAAPKLKLIQVVATGINNVDVEAAKARGIAVCNVSGYSTPSVTQHTFALMLDLLSHVHTYAAEAPKWAESPIFTRLDHSIGELAGRTLGIAGLGSIGKSVATVAEAFGMKVIGLAREGGGTSTGTDGYERLPKERFFAESDVITLHCPLTEATQDLINRETLGMMKSTAVLINTGRGPLINESDLVEALKAGTIAGAGLDVLSVEPPPADHPLLDPSIPNLMITPHTAWASREARLRLLDRVVENLHAFLAGERLNRVD